MKVFIDGDKIICYSCKFNCFDVKPAKKSNPKWKYFHAVCHRCEKKFGIVVRPGEKMEIFK